MLSMLRRSLPFAYLLSGCYSTFTALDALDGGGPPSDATADTASLEPRDAQSPSLDAREISHDARVPSSDTGPCAAGIQWIDPIPELRRIDTVIAPSLAASAEGFELLYQHASPELCDGPCPALVRIPTRGPAAEQRVAYWGWDGPAPALLVAASDQAGAPAFAIVVGQRVLWNGSPSVGDWLVPEASVTVEDAVGDVAFGAGEVLIETHRESAAGRGRLERLQVWLYTRSGTAVAPLGALDPTGGETFWAPELAVSPSAEHPWIGALMDLDFPPTVQLASRGASIGWEGSSCGVDSFDLAPESLTETLVVQDCGSNVLVRRRAAAAPAVEATIAASRYTDLPVRSRIVARNERIAVAYRDLDNFAHVVVLGRDLSMIASGTVPGSEVGPGETNPGPLGIAAHADGTFAVLWTASTAGGFPDGAVQRFRVCE